MLVGLPLTSKLLISALVLVPLGIAMGMPFPSGLRALSHSACLGNSEAKHGAVEWAWAMNAASSVLGSVLAMVIAIQFGLNAHPGLRRGGVFCRDTRTAKLQEALATQTR